MASGVLQFEAVCSVVLYRAPTAHRCKTCGSLSMAQRPRPTNDFSRSFDARRSCEVVVKEYAITNQGKVSWLVTKMHSMCTKARLATQIHQIQGKTDGSKKLGFLVDLLHTSIARSILASPSRRWIFSAAFFAGTGTSELLTRPGRSFRWARRLAAKL